MCLGMFSGVVGMVRFLVSKWLQWEIWVGYAAIGGRARVQLQHDVISGVCIQKLCTTHIDIVCWSSSYFQSHVNT